MTAEQMDRKLDKGEYRELNERAMDGMRVRMLLHVSMGLVAIEVNDTQMHDSFFMFVPSDRAADAFQHPYAYRYLSYV
jgi:hypothetical protein